MRSGLMVLGGFAATESSRRERNPWLNHTTLSGQLASSSSYHVVTAYGIASNALLDGFEIVSGDATGSGADGEGGGIRAEQTSMQLGNLLIRGNRAMRGGGAFFYESSPTVFNCRVVGNHALLDTGGLHFESSFSGSNSPVVLNCTIVGNDAVRRSTSPGLTSIAVQGTLTLRNSVLWDNVFTIPSYFPEQMYGRINAAFTLAQEGGNWPPFPAPPNALTGDPRFVNGRGADGVYGTADDDVRLSSGSPAIDSGNNSVIPADSFDLDDDGNTSEPSPSDAENGPRLYNDPATPDTGSGTGALVDMGAFEGPALAVLVAPGSVEVTEGSSVPVQVVLTRSPISSVSVSATSAGDPDLGASPSSLQFDDSNWSAAQTLTIAVAEDADSFNGSATITLAAPGIVGTSVAATERDNDLPPGIVFVNRAATGANTGANWNDAFTSLSAGLAYAASSGGNVHELWVAQGRYVPTGPSFSLLNNVAIYGGFAGTEINRDDRDWVTHPTILSGDVLGNDAPNFQNYSDNRNNVVVGTGNTPTAVLNGFIVQSGRGASPGGGGMVALSGRPTIVNCTFTLNLGAGVYFEYGSNGGPSFTDCRFVANRSTGHGGGLYAVPAVSGTSTLTFTRCEFTGNTAGDFGGGAEIWAGDAVFTDCTFSDNHLLNFFAKGGGLYLVAGAAGPAGQVTLTRCTFSNHTLTDSSQEGGGLYTKGLGSITLQDCLVHHNAGAVGAGVFGFYTGSNPNNLSLIVQGSTFEHNHATVSSAALEIRSNATVSGCTFANNSSDGNAGVGLLQGTVRNCVFLENTAAGIGGVAIGTSTNYHNCFFQGNTAGASGGAVSGDDLRFFDCTLVENRVTGATAQGGAVYSNHGATLVRSVIVGNQSSWRGGGVTAFAGSPPDEFVNCFFAGNHAADSGGGFSGNGRFVNCAWTGNSAGAFGGGVYGAFGQLRLLNCSLVANSGQTAGGAYAFNNLLDARNSVLWANTDSGPGGESAQVTAGQDASLVCNYSCVQGWTGSLGGVGNTGANPVFFDADGPDDTYGTADDSVALASGSSCIDAGRNSDVPADLFDLDGDGNTSERTPLDLGLTERFIDDALTPDTGGGTAPLTDMGAAEFLRQSIIIQPCYANCDGSTGLPVLNVNDFICFQGRFAAQDPYADCDHSSSLNVNDFICFQGQFAAGCP